MAGAGAPCSDQRRPAPELDGGAAGDAAGEDGVSASSTPSATAPTTTARAAASSAARERRGAAACADGASTRTRLSQRGPGQAGSQRRTWSTTTTAAEGSPGASNVNA